MDPMHIKPGVYKLTKPVENPAKDRRSKDWNKQEQVPTGTYIVRSYSRFADVGVNEIVKLGHATYNNITDPGDRRGTDFVDEKQVLLWDRMIAALEPVDKVTVPALLTLNHIDYYFCDDILEELVKAGKITHEDIVDAYQTFMNRPEPEDE